MSYVHPIKFGLKQEDPLSLFPFSYVLLTAVWDDRAKKEFFKIESDTLLREKKHAICEGNGRGSFLVGNKEVI